MESLIDTNEPAAASSQNRTTRCAERQEADSINDTEYRARRFIRAGERAPWASPWLPRPRQHCCEHFESSAGCLTRGLFEQWHPQSLSRIMGRGRSSCSLRSYPLPTTMTSRTRSETHSQSVRPWPPGDRSAASPAALDEDEEEPRLAHEPFHPGFQRQHRSWGLSRTGAVPGPDLSGSDLEGLNRCWRWTSKAQHLRYPSNGYDASGYDGAGYERFTACMMPMTRRLQRNRWLLVPLLGRWIGMSFCHSRQRRMKDNLL